jgi:PIN domain nuclease of toxin-antitoxin system
VERRKVILLDTHALLWWRLSPEKLGKQARRACERSATIGVSAITFWEIGVLASRGRLTLRVPLSEWTRETLEGPRMEGVSITPEVAMVAAGLGMHGDPADRIIVATALHHRCKLVTRDEELTRAKLVDVVWG